MKKGTKLKKKEVAKPVYKDEEVKEPVKEIKPKGKKFVIGDEVETPMGSGLLVGVMFIKDGTVFNDAVEGCEKKFVVSINGVGRTFEERDVKAI